MLCLVWIILSFVMMIISRNILPQVLSSVACAIVEVIGTMNTDPFLESFLSMYHENPKFRDGLLVARMSAFVSKANIHPNPKSLVDKVNFYFIVIILPFLDNTKSKRLKQKYLKLTLQ